MDANEAMPEGNIEAAIQLRAMTDRGEMGKRRYDRQWLLKEFGAVYTEESQAKLDQICKEWNLQITTRIESHEKRSQINAK